MSTDPLVIACIYDFDGTLTPQCMQEYTILPKLGLNAKKFWNEVHEEATRENADFMLTYMRLIVFYAKRKKISISKDDFRNMGSQIVYHKGVQDWFSSVNSYIQVKNSQKNHPSVVLKHYIISCGLKDILEGILIRDHFEKIYASSYYFSDKGHPTFPNIVITPAEKIQYIFRINKGKEDFEDNVHDYLPERHRPIPLSQIIYIGDGLTDVPSMSVIKKGGGHSISVYEPQNEEHRKQSKQLLQEKRVDFYAVADYRVEKNLFKQFCFLIDTMISEFK